MTERKLLTGPEAAKILGVGYTTLTRWREEGFGPVATEAGRFTLYDRADLEAWMREERPRWLATQVDGPRAKHGTVRRYAVHKCRCDLCVEAKREKNRRENERRRARLITDPESITHGTVRGYQNYKCRCAECREANTDYFREYRKRAGG